MTDQSYMQQPPPYAYPPLQPQRQKGAGLAIAALVLGIVALLLSWIPIVNYAAVILGVTGLALGTIGIFKSQRIMSIIGSALSLLAIIVSIVVFASFANAVDDAVADLNASTSADNGDSEGGDAALDAEAQANDTTDGSGPATNARGNLVKALGEEGSVTDSTGAQLLAFVV